MAALDQGVHCKYVHLRDWMSDSQHRTPLALQSWPDLGKFRWSSSCLACGRTTPSSLARSISPANPVFYLARYDSPKKNPTKATSVCSASHPNQYEEDRIISAGVSFPVSVLDVVSGSANFASERPTNDCV